MNKDLIKKICRCAARLLVFPLYLIYRLINLCSNQARSFPGFSHLLAQLPGQSGIYIRREFYRLVLPFCAKDSVIGFGTIFAHPDVQIEAGVSIGSYCCFGAVRLGEGTQIASRVSIISGLEQHQRDTEGRLNEGQYYPVIIGKHVWIGEGAIIAKNVGDFSNIGTGAVVVREVPENSTALGNPAKIINPEHS